MLGSIHHLELWQGISSHLNRVVQVARLLFEMAVNVEPPHDDISSFAAFERPRCP